MHDKEIKVKTQLSEIYNLLKVIRNGKTGTRGALINLDFLVLENRWAKSPK